MSSIGVILQVLGSILILIFLIWFAIDRMQNMCKLWFLLGFNLFCMLCAILTLFTTNKAQKVFAWLSLLFPTLLLFFLGGLLIILAILQGMNAISILLFLTVFSAIISFAGSILLLIS